MVLLVLFASISVLGALRRVATAAEKIAAHLQTLLVAVQKTGI